MTLATLDRIQTSWYMSKFNQRKKFSIDLQGEVSIVNVQKHKNDAPAAPL